MRIERAVLEVALARASKAPSPDFLRAECDYAWSVLPAQKYAGQVPRGPFTLGQLSESAQWLISGLQHEDILSNHAVWIADILRGIAYDNVTETRGQSLALTRDEVWIAATAAIGDIFDAVDYVDLAWDSSWAFSRIAIYQEVASESDLVRFNLQDGPLFLAGESSEKEALFWLAEIFEALGHFSLA
jgi:hypothetical protein